VRGASDFSLHRNCPRKFEQRDKDRYLIISDAKQSFDILWSLHGNQRELTLIPFTLKANETYTFTVKEERSRIGEDLGIEPPKSENPENYYIKIPNLIRVIRDGSLVFDREICEAHQRKMERREAPIIYGLIIPQGKQPPEQQYRTKFSHYSEQAFGGCCIMPNKTDFIYVCPYCVAAHKEWEKDNSATSKSRVTCAAAYCWPCFRPTCEGGLRRVPYALPRRQCSVRL